MPVTQSINQSNPIQSYQSINQSVSLLDRTVNENWRYRTASAGQRGYNSSIKHRPSEKKTVKYIHKGALSS